MKRCNFLLEDGFHVCGSYAFNVPEAAGGDLCDVHFYKQQRDDLLAALKAYQQIGIGNSMDFNLQVIAYNAASKAIAKAEA